MNWQNRFLAFFRRKHRGPESVELVTENEPTRIFNQLLTSYGLTPDGSSFFNVGYSFLDSDEAASFYNDYSSVLFDSLQKEFDCKIEDIRNSLHDQLTAVKNQIADHENQLNDKDEDGYLFKLNKEINHRTRTEGEFDSIISPEKELQKMVRTTIAKYQEKMDAAVAAHEDSDEPLKLALSNTRLLSSARRIIEFFKHTYASLSVIRHSLLYPPRWEYILGFFLTCVLLLIAEVGFSLTILKTLMGLGDKNANKFFGALYSIGIALSLAALFKFLIDVLLHRGERKSKQFVVVTVAIFIVLSILFSYDILIRRFAWPSAKGVVLGFFSIAFSLANALIFREASYLYHLLWSSWKDRSAIRQLRKSRKQFIDSHYHQLAALNRTRNQLQTSLARFTDGTSNAIHGLISNLRQLSLINFNRGYHQRMQDIVRHHEELRLALYRNIIPKTLNSKNQPS